MHKLAIAALVMTPTAVSASPPPASEINGTQQHRMGAFGGIRLNVGLDGAPQQREVRVVLTVAPTVQSRNVDDGARTLIGEGLAFGYRSGPALSFSLAGRDFGRSRFDAAENDGKDGEGGIPTWAIVMGGLAATAGVGYLVLLDQLGCDRGEECN